MKDERITAAADAPSTGLDWLERIKGGQLLPPAMSQVVPFSLLSVEVGRVVVGGEPTAAFYNPMGTVHGGYTATLLDTCMTCAVQSTLAAGLACTTLEIKVSFVKALTEHTGPVTAEGRVLSLGNRVATAEGRLVDREGQLYAHASTTCYVYPVS
jgi:uncharacterized protein (TIGR00369 family)